MSETLASAHLEIGRQRRLIEVLQREVRRLAAQVGVFRELTESRDAAYSRCYELYRAASEDAQCLARDLESARMSATLACPDPWDQTQEEIANASENVAG